MKKLMKCVLAKIESSAVCQNKFIGSVWFPVVVSLTAIGFLALHELHG
jgi:hypothetical protein